MPITQGLSRTNIRQKVGYNLAGPRFWVSTTTSAGAADGTTLVDSNLTGGTDEHKGKWFYITSGANAGTFRQCSAFTGSTPTLLRAFGSQVASGVTYEMWPQAWNPDQVHSLINQAIDHATGKAFDPEEDISLHLHPSEYTYTIPTIFAAIKRLERRALYDSVQIDACDSGWTQQTNVTQAFDTKRLRQGSASLRLLVAAAAAAGDNIASKTITALDIAKYDRLELWVRSSVATASGDLTLRLTSGSTTLSFDIPALTADVWTYVRMSMTADQARQLNAVDTVVVRMVVDLGAFTLWADDIRAAWDVSAQWETIPPHLWKIDKEAGTLVFSNAVAVPYNLLKITGGDEPAQLNADATVSEIDPFFIIAKATEMALMSAGGGPISDPDLLREQAAYWSREALQRMLAFPSLAGYRDVT